MDNIIAIIKNKNPEYVTQKELDALGVKIEEAIRHKNKLQGMYRELTGQNYTPPIRLAQPKKYSF